MTHDLIPEIPVTLLVLAGGRSTRLGRDKVWLELDGVPLIERVISRLLSMAQELLISANDPLPFAPLLDRLGIPARVVPDLSPGAGPLAGLEAGLGASQNDLLLAVAVDMPFVDPELIRYLVSLAPGYDLVLPYLSRRTTLERPDAGGQHSAGGPASPVEPDARPVVPEPLHAVYRKSCLGPLSARLAAGDRRMVSFHGEVLVREVLPDELAAIDPQFRSFQNINTPEDWASLSATAG